MVEHRTGLPGHSDEAHKTVHGMILQKLQSRTGFPGHSDLDEMQELWTVYKVSIPNGLPRPFRHKWAIRCRPFRKVSIPNGLPRPFRHSTLAFGIGVTYSFNPERASQAIPTLQLADYSLSDQG